MVKHGMKTIKRRRRRRKKKKACATVSTPHTLSNTSLLLISSCTKGPHGTTAEEMTKKIRENSFLQTQCFES